MLDAQCSMLNAQCSIAEILMQIWSSELLGEIDLPGSTLIKLMRGRFDFFLFWIFFWLEIGGGQVYAMESVES